jgi:hypothetical protein
MERLLVTKLVRTNGTRADLYGARHKWPDLRLFDLSELATVGIDPAALEVGKETPCRFWAIYELSDKTNQAGNPYKDVIALESIDGPATATSTDTGALLGELRAIRALLEVIASGQGLALPDMAEIDAAFPRYGDGSPVGANAAEQAAYNEHIEAEGQPPANVEALRSWYAGRRAK